MNPKIVSHFKKKDPVLYQLLKRVGDMPDLKPRLPPLYFQSLCSNIIGQQLSGKVADVFWARFIKLFPNKKPTHKKLLSLSDQTLRAIGISNSKVLFLKSLSDHFVNRKIDFKNLQKLTDSEVIGELTKIKGIGPWTAEMFLMFTLGRPDIFSAGDQGLKNAIKKCYPDHTLITEGYPESLARKRRGRGRRVLNPQIWSPYRTYACLILWKSLDQ